MTITIQALTAAIKSPIQKNGQFSPEFVRFLSKLVNDRRLNAGPPQPITLSAGAFNLIDGFSYYKLDTEGAAASDDLETIAGGNEGDLIFFDAANSAHSIVIKDGVGNIYTDGSADLTLDNTDDLALGFCNGTIWKVALWNIGA